MSSRKAADTQAPPDDTEEVDDVAEPEEELQVVWLPNGLPLFIGDVAEVVNKAQDWAETQGYGSFAVFYVLGKLIPKLMQETTTAGQKSTKIVDGEPEPQVFKVVQNTLGSAILGVEADGLGLREIKTSATFELPPIPWKMIEKLDYFFREVDRQLHTEAIAMLTWDPRIIGEGGKPTSNAWGFFIPKQQNSSTHCKYDPQSIIDDKDDEVIIVGSAHSHPGMSAYASGTDHADQEDFDGLHITFGWRHNSNVTDHHVELQMGGGTYLLKPEQAFLDAPPPPEFPDEAKEWIARVGKASTTTNTSGVMGYGGYRGSPWSGHGPAPGNGSGTSKEHQDPNKHYDQNGRVYELPDTCPDPKLATVVARLLNDEEQSCPVCDNLFRNGARERRRCWDCFAFLLMPTETVEDIVALRKDRGDAPIFELLTERAERSIEVWERHVADGNIITTAWTYHTVVPDTEAGKAPAQ